MHIISTERLSLRECTADDAAFILELLNTPQWLQFIGDRGVKNLDDAVRYLKSNIISKYKLLGYGMYVVTLRPDGQPIGLCGLVKRDTLDDADIGYALLPAFEGKGYAFEAAQATLAYAKDKLKLWRILAITTPHNTKSIQLLKKLNMGFERIVKLDGEKDLMLFSTAKHMDEN